MGGAGPKSRDPALRSGPPGQVSQRISIHPVSPLLAAATSAPVGGTWDVGGTASQDIGSWRHSHQSHGPGQPWCVVSCARAPAEEISLTVDFPREPHGRSCCAGQDPSLWAPLRAARAPPPRCSSLLGAPWKGLCGCELMRSPWLGGAPWGKGLEVTASPGQPRAHVVCVAPAHPPPPPCLLGAAQQVARGPEDFSLSDIGHDSMTPLGAPPSFFFK